MKAILLRSSLALAITAGLAATSLGILSKTNRSVVESEARTELKKMATNLGSGETDVELPRDIVATISYADIVTQ